MFIKVNAYHRAILKDYSNGDFAYLANDEVIEDVNDLDDTLLSFMLIELSEEEDCDSIETALGRLHMARDDLDVAIAALQMVQDAMIKKLEEA